MKLQKSCLHFIIALFTLLFFACTDHVLPEPGTPSEEIKRIESLKIPPQIVLPEQATGYTVVDIYFATGVQKYRAQIKAGSHPETLEWIFVAPEADLYDRHNAKIGSHFAGPSWQLTAGKDLFVAQAFSPAKAATVNIDSIDWLLLMRKPGTTPTGIFQDVDYVQRLGTKGGKAPLELPISLTQTVDVPYTAVYVFSKINP